MVKNSVARETHVSDYEDEKKLEENQDSGDNISNVAAKLLKIKHVIDELKREALTGYSKELEDLKTTCNKANALLGELNGTGGKTS